MRAGDYMFGFALLSGLAAIAIITLAVVYVEEMDARNDCLRIMQKAEVCK